MTSQQPTGFRFVPTEKELVVDYLRPKILKYPLPCDIIPVKNIYELNPEKLSDSEIGVYFFTLMKKKYPNGSYSNRVVADGCRWISKRKCIYIYNDKEKVGKKNSLKFMKAKNETDWWMDEYELIDKNKEGQLEDWVICMIRKSKSKSEKRTPAINGDIPVVKDEGQGPTFSLPQYSSLKFDGVLPMDEGSGSSGNAVLRGPLIPPPMYNYPEFNNVLPNYDYNFSENFSDNPLVVDWQRMGVYGYSEDDWPRYCPDLFTSD